MLGIRAVPSVRPPVLSRDDKGLQAERDTVPWSHNLRASDDPAVDPGAVRRSKIRQDPSIGPEVESGMAARNRGVQQHEVRSRVPPEPVRAGAIARQRKPSQARLLPGGPDPDKPQRHLTDPPHQGVPEPRLTRQIPDKISQVVPTRAPEGVIEATNEGVTAQSPFDGGFSQLPQRSFTLRVRDADRRQCGAGALHDPKCKSIFARRPCLPRKCRSDPPSASDMTGCAQASILRRITQRHLAI